MQADWARAAVIASIALLHLPPPASATPLDKARVGDLVGFLNQVGGRERGESVRFSDWARVGGLAVGFLNQVCEAQCVWGGEDRSVSRS